ncbi:unnamed protein product [Thlaspi arvense]|uniref:Uncharacterized protein n=1 Tax=Thlaspi arvense TaxID=13288 RepID=A0AAU9SVC2_THLAR|nr:unnamed protein product [Thlaspi arvense]
MEEELICWTFGHRFWKFLSCCSCLTVRFQKFCCYTCLPVDEVLVLGIKESLVSLVGRGYLRYFQI